MCGIAGIYRLGENSPSAVERSADRALVEVMLARIRYRGPDDSGIESLGRGTIGVRRLAILDVQGGHQPLADAAGRVWAVQNGEIYNFPELRRELESRHLFRTRTDTELLPHLYLDRGREAVCVLRGMFALAIFDTRDESLLLARDPLGVKPLYLARVGDRLLFSSEMKALLCDPDLPHTLDLDALGRYLALGYVPGEATLLAAVRKVRPGCRVEIRPGAVHHSRYWPWPRFAEATRPAGTAETLAREAARLIADSVQAMLLSDRPLGVLLSGGVDSGVLTALLPEARRRETRTFAIGFAGTGYHDERKFARRVASHLGTRHHELAVALDVAAELPRVVEYLDEPCADPAAVPAHLVARAASAEVTVLLSGTGGDEVFGGYRRYRLGPLLRRAAWIPRPLAAVGAQLLAEGNQHRSSLAGERRVMARKLLEARLRGTFYDAYLSTFEPANPARWAESLAVAAEPARVGAALWTELVGELGSEPASEEAASFAHDHLYYLPDDLLLKEDRTTMGASVEGRVPFLDVPLVQWAARLPLAARLGPRQDKLLLRRLARELLPAEIAGRRKHGFSVPIEEWLRGPLDTLAGDVFASPGSGLFRAEALRRWHDEHRRGKDRSGPLWAALSLELWWRLVVRAGTAGTPRAAAPPVGLA